MARIRIVAAKSAFCTWKPVRGKSPCNPARCLTQFIAEFLSPAGRLNLFHIPLLFSNEKYFITASERLSARIRPELWYINEIGVLLLQRFYVSDLGFCYKNGGIL
jgi:hypothetical protein